MKYLLLIIILINSLLAEDSLVCSSDSLAKRDYSYKNHAWGKGNRTNINFFNLLTMS